MDPMLNAKETKDDVEIKATVTKPWKAVKLPHNYQDGTDHRWAVEYVSAPLGERHTVQIADWLDERTANLVSAAPEMLRALKGVLRVADRQTVEFDAARAAIAKAEGRDGSKA